MIDIARLVDRFEDVTVRNLAWLLFAPDLLRAGNADANAAAAMPPLARPFATSAERDAVLAWLHTLDAEPDALHALHTHARNPKFTRLGKYAESLLEYFLAHGPAMRLVAANVPVRHGRRTIGECAFLLEDAAGARLHWELAVKFYLHVGGKDASAARLSDYVGPNLQDRFDLKYARLVTHQLALTTHTEFAALNLDGPWQPQAFVKGRLFYRDMDAAPAPELGDTHVRGWWQSASEWGNAAHDERVWIVQPRMAWLALRRLRAGRRRCPARRCRCHPRTPETSRCADDGGRLRARREWRVGRAIARFHRAG